MTPLTVLIVDDEAPARRRLRDVLADCAGEEPTVVAGEAASGREALEWLGRNRADVVFLDIRMPDMDGMEAAAALATLPEPPVAVFTTAYESHALQAFELDATDYLLKPVRAERLLTALRKARARLAARQPEARHIAVQERGRVLLVPLEEVVYLRAELKYVTVRTEAREYLVEDALTRLEELFGPRFVRIHRNCLVARDRLLGFERDEGSPGGWRVVLRGVEEKPPLSKRQRHLVKEFRQLA